MSNGLDPEKDRRSVGPDPGSGLDRLQRFSADDKIAVTKEIFEVHSTWYMYFQAVSP